MNNLICEFCHETIYEIPFHRDGKHIHLHHFPTMKECDDYLKAIIKDDDAEDREE